MQQPTLDIDLLRAFMAVVEHRGFTAASSGLGATQSAISQRIKKLEGRLGTKLLERSPQSVCLTHFGEEFVADAKRILQVHDEAALSLVKGRHKPIFTLGVSDHTAASLLPYLLAELKDQFSDIQLKVTVAGSNELYAQFDEGLYDIAVMRRHDGDMRGKVLCRDNVQWIAARNFVVDRSSPLPLVSLAAPCSLRSIAIAALKSSGIRWVEGFLGTGVAAVQAAISAGLGVGCLDARNLPDDCVVLNAEPWLPDLPSSEIVLHNNTRRNGVARISTAVEAIVRKYARNHDRAAASPPKTGS